MKISCECGNLILDITDKLKNKAHFISDEVWFQYLNEVDEAIENPGKTPLEREKKCMKIRSNDYFDPMWECTHCGRIHFLKGGKLIVYSPENAEYNSVLKN